MQVKWYVIGALALVVLLVIVRHAVVVWRGSLMLRAIRETVATDQVNAVMVDWLREDPRRLQQKDIFLQVMSGLGTPQAHCAQLVTRCIMAAWKPGGRPFGELLAAEMERSVTFNRVGIDRGQDAKRQRGKDAVDAVRAKLRALDSEATSAA